MMPSPDTAKALPSIRLRAYESRCRSSRNRDQTGLVEAWVKSHEKTPDNARVTVKQIAGWIHGRQRADTVIEILSAGRPRMEYRVRKTIDELTWTEVDRLLAWHAL